MILEHEDALTPPFFHQVPLHTRSPCVKIENKLRILHEAVRHALPLRFGRVPLSDADHFGNPRPDPTKLSEKPRASRPSFAEFGSPRSPFGSTLLHHFASNVLHLMEGCAQQTLSHSISCPN